jgi:hypothetical protein
MGARAEYSQWGGITAPTRNKSRQGRGTFKTSGDFLTFSKGNFTAQQADLRRQ